MLLVPAQSDSWFWQQWQTSHQLRNAERYSIGTGIWVQRLPWVSLRRQILCWFLRRFVWTSPLLPELCLLVWTQTVPMKSSGNLCRCFPWPPKFPWKVAGSLRLPCRSRQNLKVFPAPLEVPLKIPVEVPLKIPLKNPLLLPLKDYLKDPLKCSSRHIPDTREPEEWWVWGRWGRCREREG